MGNFVMRRISFHIPCDQEMNFPSFLRRLTKKKNPTWKTKEKSRGKKVPLMEFRQGRQKGKMAGGCVIKQCV